MEISIALVGLIVLWWGLIAYAVLGGADFGAGVWDLFAVGRTAERQRDFINHALGPVWEANHVWLIFLIVGLFTMFPGAFEAIVIALHFPLALALIGIVMRGAAFIFRYYAVPGMNTFARLWGRVFSVSSLLTPFFLGTAAAAVASGHLLGPNGQADAAAIASWTSPFALTIGAMAVTLCATEAGIYLAAEAQKGRETELAEAYRWKALIAGAITAVLGAIGLLLSPTAAPALWDGMLGHGIPLIVITMLVGLATAGALWLKRYALARALVVVETAFILSTWGLSQYPFLIPPSITIDSGANEPNVIRDLLIAFAVGAVILLPSLYYLFSVFKLSYPAPGIREEKHPEA
jgi:cytochrome d ubiquinol oxidase subunit II